MTLGGEFHPGPERTVRYETTMMDVTPFLTRVVLKNYKSIAASGVDLRALTFLVGPNGSGKSSFLDALRFTSDSLRSSLDNALRERGGIAEVRRRSGGHPTHFGIRLEFQLPSAVGHYAFRIGARPQGGYEVQTEECAILGPEAASFLVIAGEVKKFELGGTRNGIAPPAALKDRLYLVNVSGVPKFRGGFVSQIQRRREAPTCSGSWRSSGRALSGWEGSSAMSRPVVGNRWSPA
jgi:hypothetical protein